MPRIALNAHVHVSLDATPNEVLDGAVGTIGTQVDPTTRSVTVRVRLSRGEGALHLGLFGIIRSLSKYGISVVTVVFEDGTDIYFARKRVGPTKLARHGLAVEDVNVLTQTLGELEGGPDAGSRASLSHRRPHRSWVHPRTSGRSSR